MGIVFTLLDAPRAILSAFGGNSNDATFNERCLQPPIEFSKAEIAEECKKYELKAQGLAQITSEIVRLTTFLDLTTLSGDDTPQKVRNLTDRALKPFSDFTLGSSTDQLAVHCAATCTYPARVADVAKRLRETSNQGKIGIASVAGGFPSGQFHLESRLLEIQLAVRDGATEIDTVINRSAALNQEWRVVFDEVKQMRKICGGSAHLKTILATGELKTLENIYKASMASMMAGSEFIKTSTGKEPVNATLESAYVMCTAIRHFFTMTGKRVGFKPAGGIRTIEDGFSYLCLVESICGPEWITPKLFRIGASGLLNEIESAIICQNTAT